MDTNVEMIAVDSSSISAIGYNHSTQQCFIEFNNNRTYRYDGVPTDAFDELLGAESIGKHFHRNFKGVYPSEKLEG